MAFTFDPNNVLDPSTTEFLLGLAVFVPVAVLGYIFLTKKRSSLPLPPGPKGEFLLGHLRVIPAAKPEVYYQQLSKELNSDILSFNVLGQPVIVLNSLQAAMDLLDKRGANYADRPSFESFFEMGWEGTLTFLRWGERYKRHRRILQNSFTKGAIVKYRDLQTSETAIAIKSIMARPEGWESSLRRFATAIVLGIGFGVEVHGEDDPHIKMAEDASYALGHGGAPAGTLVDFFPFIRRLPNWLARSSALKYARDWRWAIRAIHDIPTANAQKAFAEGRARPSFITTLLEEDAAIKERGEVNPMTLADIKGASAAVFIAGSDTTWSTLVVFVLNMVLHPDVQAEAQAQLDEVVGADRLPEFDDRDNLPLITWIVQETLRWCPVSPIGVPHRSIEDDTYKGFFIPKGSFVYANAQAITHDPETYENPDEFEPSRYKPKAEGGRGEPFPTGGFGFGRRVCVGKHLAEASVWMVVATTLHTMRIKKALGPDGKEIIPVVTLTPGLTSHPERFPCVWESRGAQYEQLIADASH